MRLAASYGNGRTPRSSLIFLDDFQTAFEIVAESYRGRGFRISKAQLIILAAAYANAAVSIIPYINSSIMAGEDANIPGTEFIPNWPKFPLRVALYLAGSLFATNLLLNGETAKARLLELRQHYLGDTDNLSDSALGHYRQLMPQRSWASIASDVVKDLVSFAWAGFGASWIVGLGLQTGMNPAFVPFVFVASMLLNKAGSDKLVKELAPFVLSYLWNYSFGSLPLLPKLAQVSPKVLAIEKLRQARLATLSDARREIEILFNNNPEQAADLSALLEQPHNAHVCLDSISRLAKAAPIATGFEVTVRMLVKGLTNVSTLAIYGFFLAALQYQNGDLLKTAISFMPFFVTLFGFTGQLAQDIARIVVNLPQWWRGRGRAIAHYPWSFSSSMFLLVSLAVFSSGSLLIADQNGANYLLGQFGYCPLDGSEVEETGTCENIDYLLRPAQVVEKVMAFWLTQLMNSYGIPPTLSAIYLLVARGFGNQNIQQQHRLLAFIDRNIDLVKRMSPDAFLAVVLMEKDRQTRLIAQQQVAQPVEAPSNRPTGSAVAAAYQPESDQESVAPEPSSLALDQFRLWGRRYFGQEYAELFPTVSTAEALNDQAPLSYEAKLEQLAGSQQDSEQEDDIISVLSDSSSAGGVASRVAGCLYSWWPGRSHAAEAQHFISSVNEPENISGNGSASSLAI